MAANSKSLSGSIVSGSIAAAGAGVALGRLGDMRDYKLAGQYLLDVLSTIHTNVTGYLIDINASNEVLAFDNRIKELTTIVAEASTTAKTAGKWYNTSAVWVVLLFFWPVGVYGLIKRNQN